MHRRFAIIATLAGAIIVSYFTSTAEAARIEKVKGKQVLIDNEDTAVQEGEKFFAVIDGKKKGVIVITKVKGKKSIGNITKGRADANATLESTQKKSADGSEGKRKRSEPSAESETEVAPPATTVVGAIAGYATNSQTVNDGSSTYTMSGSGYSIKGYGDMPTWGSLGLIARGGIEQFDVAGSGKKTSIMYLTGDLLLRFAIGQRGFVPYVAAGLGIHYPLSKSSSSLDESRISATTIFFGTAGFNYKLSGGMYFTMLAEYGYIPPSSTVSTSLIALRTGVGWNY